MKISPFRWLIITLLILSQTACEAQESNYLHQDPKACASLLLNCQEDQHPFHDAQGCGCQKRTATNSNPDRYYVNQNRQTCATLLFRCEPQDAPFFDEQGCGCQKSECVEDEKISPANVKYQRIEMEKAGVSFEVPDTWVQAKTDSEWSPSAQNPVVLGFKWVEVGQKWEPHDMLPEKADYLGPYNIDLGWERGLLYLVQPTQNKTNGFEIHVVIPRMEVEMAYDFYAKAPGLIQLKAIEVIQQNFISSGQLNSVKYYVIHDVEECEKVEIECQVGEETFSDETGCGCVTSPQEEAIYDN